MNWNNKNVLVAGGAGMIGSHLAGRLVKMGANVTIADDLSSGSERNIQNIRKDARFIPFDLRTKTSAEAATKDKDAVFQLAANMGGVKFISTVGANIMRDSALININMLEASRKNDVPLYFYSSSA